MTADSACGNENTGPVIHNTSFCQVDPTTGRVVSGDQLPTPTQDGDVVHSGGGGCIERPIRDVWGVFLNDAVMKPDDDSTYTSTARPELIPQTSDNRVVMVFDLYNYVKVLVFDADWVVRWYHSIEHGSYETPNEVAINFQKVSGTGHIRELSGGYVLDRVTDSVTSFVMDQHANADRYDIDKAKGDVKRMFERLRNGAPEPLPDKPQFMVQPN